MYYSKICEEKKDYFISNLDGGSPTVSFLLSFSSGSEDISIQTIMLFQ